MLPFQCSTEQSMSCLIPSLPFPASAHSCQSLNVPLLLKNQSFAVQVATYLSQTLCQVWRKVLKQISLFSNFPNLRDIAVCKLLLFKVHVLLGGVTGKQESSQWKVPVIVKPRIPHSPEGEYPCSRFIGSILCLEYLGAYISLFGRWNYHTFKSFYLFDDHH